MRILVVEDEPVSRLLLGATLRQLGHEPVLAESGRAAWAAFREAPPTPLVITDWLMADVDGLELSRLIRGAGRAPYTYIILLTVMQGKGAYLEGMRAGVDDYIEKPFDPDMLGARLRVAERILGLQTQVRRLEGLLPICMYCKNIRDGDEAWVPIEVYIGRRSDASFSHGVCPSCLTAVVEPQLDRWRREQR